MYVLCTGGLGYIGSHTCVQLIEQGHKVAILDNCANSSPVVLDRIAQITGRKDGVKFFELDLLEKEKVAKLFAEEKFDAVATAILCLSVVLVVVLDSRSCRGNLF